MPDPTPEPNPIGQFEDFPLTRQEYINVMVHFYRAEVSRSTNWRQRLDATTNWAVITMGAMLSFSFANAATSHILLLLSNLVIVSYLMIEGRRYRYFEVYRARVRMLEENFLLPVINRQLVSPMGQWREAIASDLDSPKYKTTLIEAVGFRLRRNYMGVFTILLGAWIIKLVVHPRAATSIADLWARVSVGAIPAWVVLGGGTLFYAAMIVVGTRGKHIHGMEPEDEITGIESSLERWKL